MTRHSRRRLTVIIAALMFVTPAGVGAAAPPTAIAGLLDNVEIARDVRGIAHITASNDHDLFFLQGWGHAENRLFQMDMFRRVPSSLSRMVSPGLRLIGDGR